MSGTADRNGAVGEADPSGSPEAGAAVGEALPAMLQGSGGCGARTIQVFGLRTDQGPIFARGWVDGRARASGARSREWEAGTRRRAVDMVHECIGDQSGYAVS